MKSIRFAVLFTFLTIPSLAHAMIYWSSVAGGAGSCAAASGAVDPGTYRTMTQGFACLAAGDTLYLKAGTYSTQITFSSFPSGASTSAKTTIRNAPGESVTISRAGQVVTGAAGKTNIIVQGLILVSTTADAVVDISNNEVAPLLSHIEILDNDLTNGDKNGSCMQSAGSNHIIRGNNIHDCGSTDQAHGIYTTATGELVEKNLIHDVRGWGIHCYPSCDTPTFRSNKIYANGSGGITMHGGGGNGRVHNNWIYENGPDWGGIRCGVGSCGRQGDKIWNNVIVGNNSFGIVINAGTTNIEYRNNIVWNNTTNISDAAAGSQKSNNLTTNPGFTNVGTDDYTLLGSAATAIDAGIAVGLPANGLPDIGATSTPKFASCAVEAATPTVVNWLFTSNAARLIPATGITGFTAKANAVAKTNSSVVRLGDVGVNQTVTAAFIAGDTIAGTISGTNMAAETLIGNVSNQLYVETTTDVACANRVAGAGTYAWHLDAYRFFEARAPLATAQQFKRGSLGANEDNANAEIHPAGLIVLDLAVVGKTADPPPEGFYLNAKLNGGVAFALTDSYGTNKIRYCGESDIQGIPDAGGSVPNRTALAGAYTAGQLVRRQLGVPTIDLPLNGKTQSAYCLDVDPAAVAGDYFEFELRRQDGTSTALVFNQVPRLTVTTPSSSGFAELWDLLMLTFLPRLGRIETNTQKPSSSFVVGFPNVDQVTLEGMNCPSGLKTTGSGTKRTVTCLH